MHLVGTHINNLIELGLAIDLGSTVIQIMYNTCIHDNSIIKLLNKNKDLFIIVHGSYTINIASQWDKYSWWCLQFINEIKFAFLTIKAKMIIIHLGKNTNGVTKSESYNNMFTFLLYIYEKTKNYNIKIVLESSSGSGNELCYRLDDLAYFFKKLSHHPNKDIADKFGICIDTCHIFSAGYNINNKINIMRYLETFEELIGIKYIMAIHLNNSKNKLGSLVDRHESINKGNIPITGLKHFIKYFKKINIPIVLETPNNSFLTEIPKYLL